MHRLAQPTHPGPFIRMEILEPLQLTVTAAAKILKVTRPALSSFVNAHAALSPEMALRIEKAFGLKMESLMRMQNSYDIAQTRAREKDIRVSRYRHAHSLSAKLTSPRGQKP
jgi:addiction module HigA family antidote